jgi:hypothetical protein
VFQADSAKQSDSESDEDSHLNTSPCSGGLRGRQAVLKRSQRECVLVNRDRKGAGENVHPLPYGRGSPKPSPWFQQSKVATE